MAPSGAAIDGCANCIVEEGRHRRLTAFGEAVNAGDVIGLPSAAFVAPTASPRKRADGFPKKGWERWCRSPGVPLPPVSNVGAMPPGAAISGCGRATHGNRKKIHYGHSRSLDPVDCIEFTSLDEGNGAESEGTAWRLQGQS